jgi:hypothetical protein
LPGRLWYWAIDLPFGHELRAEWLHHATQCRKEGVSSNGIPLKKVLRE